MSGSGVLCPFDLTVDTIDRMLNFEIADDPTYTGLEIQAFDQDPEYGHGLLAFLTRRDNGRAYIYHQPGLRLDPRQFQVGHGLGGWTETALAPARLDITDRGVVAALGFHDDAGRSIDVRIDDRSHRRRRPGRLLAPFGAAVENPTSLLLAYMGCFDLLRRRGREFHVVLDDHPLRTGSLPGGWLHRRRLVKYAADIVVVRLNQAQDGPIQTLDPAHPGNVELATDSSIAGISAERRGHHVRLTFAPAVPDLSQLQTGTHADGGWNLDIDDMSIGGRWWARRRDQRVDLVLDVTRGWKPADLPPLMRLMTAMVRMFRTWPTSYRWTAAITLAPDPWITSQWERKRDRRDNTYRRLTRSAAAR